MPSGTDPQRRPVYIDRVNNRLLAEPIGAGPWPVVNLTSPTPPEPTLPAGTLTQAGIVQLNDSTSSNSTSTAATPSAVKTAYDLAVTASSSLVTTVRLDDAAVTTAKIAGGAITTAKLGDGAVTVAKIGELYTTTTTATSKTLVNRERCTVTASGQTITLPASPSAGWEVAITIAGNFTDTIVARNGVNIMSLAENLTIDQAHLTVTLYYVDATRGWRII